MLTSGIEKIISRFHDGLQICCCPVQKHLPRMTELAWQLCQISLKGLSEFQNKFKTTFTIIFKLKNDNSKTRDFSPLIERVLAGVGETAMSIKERHKVEFKGF